MVMGLHEALPWLFDLGLGVVLIIGLILYWNNRLEREIAERRRIERRLSLALEGGALGLWDVDLATEFVVVNDIWAEMLGYNLEEIQPVSRSFWIKTIHPDDRERVLQAGRACQAGEQEHYVVEYRAIAKDGLRWLLSRGAVVERDGQGKPTRMVGTVQDITVRKNAEDMLRESDERSSLILSSVTDGIFVMDISGRTTFANQAAAAMLGFTVEELIGIPMHSTIHHTHPDGSPYPATQCPTGKTCREGIACQIDNEMYWRKDGTGLHVEYTSVPMHKNKQLVGAVVVFRDVTQRRAAETRMSSQEQQFRTLLESAPDAMVITQADGTIIMVNQQTERMFGYGRNDLLGQPVEILLPSALQAGHLDNRRDFLAMPSARSMGSGRELLAQTRDGRQLPVEISLSPIATEEGILIASALRDISERRQAEHESRKLLQAVEQSPVSIVIAHCSGQIEYVNPAFTMITGYAREEVIGQNPRILTSGEIDDVTFQQLWQTILGGQVWHGTLLNRRRNGELFWEEASIAPILDDKGQITNFLAVKVDITDHKRAEQALRASEERYALVVRGANDGIWDWNPGQNDLYFSPRYMSMLGHLPEGFPHCLEEWSQRIHPDDREQVMAVYMSCANGLVDSFHVEYRLQHKDGHWIWVLGRGAHIKNASGQVVRLTGTHTDITERKNTEETIRILNQLVYGSLESASVGAWWIDFTEEDTFHALDTTARLLGLAPSVLADKSYKISELLHLLEQTRSLHTEHAKMINDTLVALRGTISGEHEFFNATYPMHREEGVIRWLNARGNVSRWDAQGGALLMTGTVIDITDQKDAELAMEEAKRVAEEAVRMKADFVANMSHEIRTPMNGVIGMLDVLQQSELTTAQRNMVGTIQESSVSLLHILNDILDFSKIEAGKMEVEQVPTPLREVIEGVAQLMFETANAKLLDMLVFVSPQLPLWIDADATRLRQVLLNLLGNAVKFTAHRADRPGWVMVRCEPVIQADGGTGLQLRILDNGIGMSQKTLKKLFKPFNQADESTSRKYGGTGLGLSITHRLVELMHGTIAVHSVLGEGTEFMVQLPLHKTSAGRQMVPEPDLQGVNILLVADDTACAEIVLAYCRAAGADVTWVSDLATVADLTPPLTVLLAHEKILDWTEHLPEGVQLVHILRRGQKSLAVRSVTVSATPLLYHDLIRSIAIANGRMGINEFAALTDRRQQPRMPVPTVEEAIASNQLILLAEDNCINRSVMYEQLRLLGYTAEVAEDGDVALNMWRTGRYALLLTDCHMPNMDGFALTQAILQEEIPGRHKPIIAVTASALQGEAEHCIAQGMDDYLSKPLRMHELGAMLNKWLPRPVETTAAQHTLFDPVADPMASKDGRAVSSDSPSMPVWDGHTLTRMVGNNPAMQRRLLEKFLGQAMDQMVAIRAAIDRGDTVVVGEIAHTGKSAARMVGALQLGERLQEMELTGKKGELPGCQSAFPLLNETLAAAIEAIKKHLDVVG